MRACSQSPRTYGKAGIAVPLAALTGRRRMFRSRVANPTMNGSRRGSRRRPDFFVFSFEDHVGVEAEHASCCRYKPKPFAQRGHPIFYRESAQGTFRELSERVISVVLKNGNGSSEVPLEVRRTHPSSSLNSSRMHPPSGLTSFRVNKAGVFSMTQTQSTIPPRRATTRRFHHELCSEYRSLPRCQHRHHQSA